MDRWAQRMERPAFRLDMTQSQSISHRLLRIRLDYPWTAFLSGLVSCFLGCSPDDQLRVGIPHVSTNGLDQPVITLLHDLESDVRNSPRDDMAWGKLGMTLRTQGFDREAAVCLQEARDLNPDEARWPYHLARVFVERNQEEALQHLRRAVELCGDRKDYPRLWLGRLLAERGRWDEAESLLEPWLRKQPNHAGARLLQAQAAFARNEWEPSARSLSVCLTNRFTARQAHSLLGQIYLRLGREEDAAAAGRIVQALPADDPWPDSFEEELGQFRVSRRQLIETVPVLLAEQQPGEARRLTDRLLRDYPDASEGWLFLGRLEYLAENWPAAEEALSRHLEMEPDSVDGHMQLGQLRLRQNEPGQAAASFSRVAALKPDSQIAHYQLGEAQLRSGETNAAMASWERAIQCEPSFMEPYLRLAQIQFRHGQKEEALARLNQALSIDPYDMRVQEALEMLQRP